MFQQMVEFFFIVTATGNRDKQENNKNKKIRKEGKEEKKNRWGSATGRIRHRRRGIFFLKLAEQRKK